MSLMDRLRAHNARRPHVTVRLADVCHDWAGDEMIDIRALTVAEVDEATVEALRHRAAAIKQVPENQRHEWATDASLIDDARHVEVLARACRDPEDRSKQAFPSGQWMREHFTLAELAALLESYEWAVRLAAGWPPALDGEQLRATAEVIALASPERAEKAIAKMPVDIRADLIRWLARQVANPGHMPAPAIERPS